MLINSINSRNINIKKHKIHLEDNGKVGYKNYCKKCNKELLSHEIGTEYKDKVLTDEQLENIKEFVESNTIEVLGFKKLDVNAKKDFFMRTYYILPDISKNAKKGEQKNFYAFINAIKNLGLVGICLFTNRGNQQIGLFYVEDRAKLSLIPFNEVINQDIMRLEEQIPKFDNIPTKEAELFIKQNINEKLDYANIKNTIKEQYEKAIKGKLKMKESVEICVFSEAVKKGKELKVKIK